MMKAEIKISLWNDMDSAVDNTSAFLMAADDLFDKAHECDYEQDETTIRFGILFSMAVEAFSRLRVAWDAMQ